MLREAPKAFIWRLCWLNSSAQHPPGLEHSCIGRYACCSSPLTPAVPNRTLALRRGKTLTLRGASLATARRGGGRGIDKGGYSWNMSTCHVTQTGGRCFYSTAAPQSDSESLVSELELQLKGEWCAQKAESENYLPGLKSYGSETFHTYVALQQPPE